MESPVQLHIHTKKIISFQRPSEVANNNNIQNQDNNAVEEDDDADINDNEEAVKSEIVVNKSFKESFAEFRKETRFVFVTSRSGFVYRHTMIALSIFSLIAFIVEVYRNRIMMNLERVVASLFLWDWCLSLFLSNVPFFFISSPSGIVDLFSVIPIWFLDDKIPDISSSNHSASESFEIFMYVISISRVLRALRVIYVDNPVKDPVVKCLIESITQFLIIMLFNAGMMNFIEQEQDLPFHVWLYFIWVTTATVGYGDVNPQSTAGRFITMGIIGFSILYVPTVTSNILELMGLESKYARLSYVTSMNCKHIVICGDLVSISSMREFLEELFHEDHNNNDENGNLLQIVILQPNPPSPEMAALLIDPVFSLRLTYIEGSALTDKALDRCCINSAIGIFVMANKFSTRADEEDAKTLLQSLSIRRYNERKNTSLTSRFYLQIIKSENARLVPPNNAKSKTVVICLNDIKMGLMAKASVYPGTSTFILNLITSIAHRSSDTDGEMERRWQKELNKRALLLGSRHSIYSVAAAPTGDLFSSSRNLTSMVPRRDRDWVSEYSSGCDWEVYTVPLATVFQGSRFVDASYIVAQRTTILVIGLYIIDLSCGLSKVLLNPGSFVIPSSESCEVNVIVMAKDKKNALQLSVLSESDTLFYANAFRHSKSEARKEALSKTTTKMTRRTLNQVKSVLGMSVETEPESKDEHLDRISMVNIEEIAESMDKVPENFIKLELSVMKQRTHILDCPRNLSDCTISGSIIDWFPGLMHHIIIMGKDLSNVYDLIKPLRAKYLGPVKTIVILHPFDIADALWNRISIFPEIYLIKGSSLHEVDILRSGIFRAQQVVVLADACSHEQASLSKSATHALEIEALVDTDALFTYQCVKKLVPHVHIVVEMFQQKNISYLELSSMLEGFRLSKAFASGYLFTSCMLDSLVCQTFYNPVHMKIVEKLVCGVDHIDRDALLIDAIADEMDKLGTERKDLMDVKNSILNSVKESCLYLIEIPDQCHGKSYRSLFEALAKSNIIPLGLLRAHMNKASNSAAGTASGNEYYVFTNPTRSTIVGEFDKVFVLSPTPLAPVKETTRLRSVADYVGGHSNRSSMRTGTPRTDQHSSAKFDLSSLEDLLDGKLSKFTASLEKQISDVVESRVLAAISSKSISDQPSSSPAVAQAAPSVRSSPVMVSPLLAETTEAVSSRKIVLPSLTVGDSKTGSIAMVTESASSADMQPQSKSISSSSPVTGSKSNNSILRDLLQERLRSGGVEANSYLDFESDIPVWKKFAMVQST